MSDPVGTQIVGFLTQRLIPNPLLKTPNEGGFSKWRTKKLFTIQTVVDWQTKAIFASLKTSHYFRI